MNYQATLTMIIDAKNKASATFKDVQTGLSGVQKKLDSMQPAFKKMAAVGSVAFAGIAVAAKRAIDQAAKAEGTYNKFNTVFGTHAEAMNKFIKDIRKEMPTATSEIARMSADLQDLLVPMGLTREKGTEMTMGFVDLANKVAAFNDVDPTEILEAIKSGLSGSSEPLRRFGINALESALEARALKDGLLEAGQSFKDLDPEVKNQIRAQALLAQAIDNSSDAINGFAENNDSYIRRQQNLNATLKEFQETVGKALLSAIDSILKSLLPVVQKLGEWAEKNPELTKKIVIIAGAIAGMVAVTGTLGLALKGIMPVITGAITIFKLLGTTLTFLAANPIGIAIMAIGAIVAAGIILWKNWDRVVANLKALWEGLKSFFGGIVDWFTEKTEPFINLVKKIGDAVGTVMKYTGIGAIGSVIGGVKDLVIGSREQGGYIPKTGPYLLHEGEEVIPKGGKAGNSFTFNFNGDVNDKEKLIDQVIRAINRQTELTTVSGQ